MPRPWIMAYWYRMVSTLTHTDGNATALDYGILVQDGKYPHSLMVMPSWPWIMAYWYRMVSILTHREMNSMAYSMVSILTHRE